MNTLSSINLDKDNKLVNTNKIKCKYCGTSFYSKNMRIYIDELIYSSKLTNYNNDDVFILLKCFYCDEYSPIKTLMKYKKLDLSNTNITSLNNIDNDVEEINCYGCLHLKINKCPMNIKRINLKYCRLDNIDSLLFTYLTYINISDCENIRKLPLLPLTLKTLKCSNTHITSLESIPETLIKLNCSGCVYLFNFFKLKKLIHLEYLDCSYTQFNNFTLLSNSLKKLKINKTLIYNFESLPEKLISLHCKNIRIKNLEDLPSTIEYLNISCCKKLKSLYTNTDIHLNTLICREININNFESMNFIAEHIDISNSKKLISLYGLKFGILSLDVSSTSIKSFQYLPHSLKVLDCTYCINITSLRYSSESLIEIDISNTNIISLVGLKYGVRKIICRYCYNLFSFYGCPESIKYIDHSYTNIKFFNDLPESIVKRIFV